MSKIGDPICVRPTAPSVAASEVHETSDAAGKSVEEKPCSTSTATAANVAQEKRHEMRLQGSIRQKELAATSIGKCPDTQLKSDAEIRQAFQKVFPALKEGIAQAGLDVNGNSCNVAAAMLKNVLDKQGIEGATIKEGPMHAYVEVKTKEGKTLILDPTASQFFKDGSPIDGKLQSEGFVGTKDELKKMISDNIEHFSFPKAFEFPQKEVLDAFRGKQVDGISREEAAQALSPFLEMADRTYFSETKGTLGDAARRQAEWRDQGNLDAPFIDSFGGNIAPRLKKGYEAMEQRLNQ